MTSEIRANIIKNRVGLGTIEYSNTGPVISGVTTASNFKTGTSNLHSTGLNVQDLDVDGHTELDNVNVSGIITSASARVNGATILNGNVDFYGSNYGIAWNKSAGRLGFLDNATLSFGNGLDTQIKHNNSHLIITNTTGNIDVTGNVLLNNDLDVDGTTSVDSFEVSGVSTFSGNIKIADRIKHIGDEDTQIRFPAADTISFETAGSERARIDSSGRLLLGTTTEGHFNADDLTIATSGDTGITIRSGTTNNGRIYFSDATSGAGEVVGSLDYDHNINKFSITTNGESRLKIDSSGRVLIGTDTEGHPNADDLTIATSGDTGITIRSGTTHNGRIYFSDATSGTGEVVGSLDYDHNDDFFRIYTAGGERFRIDSSGRLLLGTANVGHPNADDLTVSTSGDTGITIRSGTSSNGRIYFSDATSGAGQVVGSLDYDHDGDFFRIYTAGGERLRILANGNVGINQTDPTCQLQIDSGSSGAGTVTHLELNHKGNDTNDAVKLNFARAGSDIGSIVLEKVASNNTTDFIFNTRSFNTVSESMRITGAGKVGINHSSPDSNLVVKTDGLDDNTYAFKTVYRSGSNASGYTASGISITSSADNNNGENHTAYLQFSNRDPALNGSHGASAFITMTTNGVGNGYGNGQFDFYCRNGAEYGFPNDPQVSSGYWMSSLFRIKSTGELFGYGNLRIDTGTAADGIVGRAYGTSYFGMKQADQGASEYMMINNNSNTYISCTSGYSVYIRPSANSQSHETLFAHDNTTFKTNVVLDNHALRRNHHQWGHMEGGHNNIGSTNTKTSPIYTIGSAYNPNENDLNNMYGIGYCHSDASFINSNVTGGWGQYVASDGDARIFLNAGDGVVYSKGYGRIEHDSGHLIGSYNNIGANSGNTNPIYTIGSSYNPQSSSLSNMYGIGYSHGNNASFISFSGLTGWGLYVAADGDCRMFLDATTGKIAATSTITQNASDVRLKTNIKVIDNPIEKIKKIRGVTFDWVDNITTEYDFHPDSMHETGVIAQEIQEVIPDAVATAPFNGNYTRKSGTDNNYLTVKNEKIIPLCIEAIKKLTAKVESLEQENTALKARVTSLEE